MGTMLCQIWILSALVLVHLYCDSSTTHQALLFTEVRFSFRVVPMVALPVSRGVNSCA